MGYETSELHQRPSRGRSRMGEEPPDRSRSRSRHRSSAQHYQRSNNNYNMPPQQGNRFSYLNNNVHEHETINSSNRQGANNSALINKDKNDSAKTNQSGTVTKEYVPAIKVTNKSISDMRNAITKIKNIKLSIDMFRPTQFGNYIYAQSVSDFKVIRKYCDDNGFKYFTHPLDEEKVEKFCLYGLEQMDHDVLKHELSQQGHKPVNISEIPIKNKRFDEHCIYVLHFMKKQGVRLDDLKRITGLFNTRIKFSAYDNPNKHEPVQCKRCQSYNHGIRGCNLDFKCRRCAGPHPSSECDYLPNVEKPCSMDGDDADSLERRDPKGKIDPKYVKCANCGGPHTANYKGCQARRDIVQLRDAIRHRNTHIRQKIPKFDDQSQFRPLPPPGRPNGNNSWKTPQSAYVRPSSSYHKYETSHQSTHQDNYQYNHQNTDHQRNNQQQDDLFNVEECMMIMQDIARGILRCKNKFEQLAMIGQITAKYLPILSNGY